MNDRASGREMETLRIERDALLETARKLRDEAGFDMLVDVTAVDWLGRKPRFDVVYHLYSTRTFLRTRITVGLEAGDPAIDSLTPLYGAAQFAERECHDMYGIVFRGNPDLRPILLYDGFQGHPLRKDYPIGREQPLVPERTGAGAASSESIANPVTSAFGAMNDAVVVSIGPSHPATHGTIQIFAALDGERVKRADVHCGYLHRGFEKECEAHTWHNLIPYVDRLNYCSGLVNNFAYCAAVEQLMGIEVTPRTKYLRTLLSEYSRLCDHITCVAASLMELGAMTAFLYLVMIRDYMYEHIAALTGARVTYTYGRIGGLARDLPEGWLKRLEEIFVQYGDFIGRVHGLVDRNRIFIDRMRNVGCLTTAQAIDLGVTGPMLRSTGCPRDLRKDTPYLAYAELDFDVPVGIKGDNYDRYYVRMREMDESVYMMRQLVDMLPAGPLNVDDRRCSFPDKTLVYSEIETLINHFKLVSDGPNVPAGEVYVAHESPNGELGFHLVSTGGGTPYKVHVRAPSFVHMGAAAAMLEGYQLADVVPTFGSINMIGGECDR
jgi:NADH-quinone oxidoreductase subunit D